MSLRYKLTGNILEVVETLPGWSGTKVTYWYYDIEKWLVSTSGREGSTPTLTMLPSAIEWVKKHYLPYVQ